MAKEELTQWTFKILLLGDMAVGKTSLINQYLKHSFEEDYKPTLGVNIITIDLEIKEIDTLIKLIIWDIAGQDKYEKFRRSYYEGCSGALLVYDLTRQHTLNNIEKKWFKDVKNHVTKKIDYVLIGNKLDLEDSRVINSDEGNDVAKKINAVDFIETSAKNGENVEDAFLTLIYNILNKFGIKININ
ncbi:MAG: GTP-binding protein [Promethearchaeota archaeon]|nr:MAG: GTP-binding protein [Candidatus Lokiarchaeota archaeon]